MKSWRKLGIAGLAAVALAFGVQRADARCIDPNTNTVETAADCRFATGGTGDVCRVAVGLPQDSSGTPFVDPKKIVCIDGEACDADGTADGTCTFRVGICVNVPNGGCDTAPITASLLSKPGVKEATNAFKTPLAVYNQITLENGLASLEGSAVNACTDADLPVKVNLKLKGACASGGGCTSDLECTADETDSCIFSAKKNKANVSFSVSDAADDYGVKFKLTCAPSATNPAHAFVIADSNDLIGGPLAMGRVGDFMIRNGNVRAVVRAPGRQHSFMLLNGGEIMDADLVRSDPSEDRDSFKGIQPEINICSSQATTNVDVLNAGTDPELSPAAIIESSGDDDLFDPIKPDVLVTAANSALTVPAEANDVDIPISVKTHLILSPYSNVIEMATTITNNGGSGTAHYFMGDFINPGGQLEPFGPGQGYGETQIRNGSNTASPGQTLDFLAFQGRMDAAGLTYGVVFPQAGASPQVGATKTGTFASSGVYAYVSNNNLFDTLFGNMNAKDQGGFAVTGNGGEKTFRRWFVIGKTISDVTKAHTEIFLRPKSALQGFVKDTDGNPVADAHVTLVKNGNTINGSCSPNTDCHDIFTSTLTDENGFYRFIIPAGDYDIYYRKGGTPYPGHDDVPTLLAGVITEEKKTTVAADLVLPKTGTVTVNVVDELGNPIAAKVSIVGPQASPDPLNREPFVIPQFGRFFGYDFEEKGDVFGLAEAKFADASGTTGTFDLEPGTYRVVVSHGYEYDADNQALVVTEGANTTINAVVRHVVDTTGFVSIDTHVHMINSPDSTITRERRITSMIAEGVDFFVNTDHDFIHSLADEISSMGVGSLIANSPSDEVTTSHYGHFNVWPLTVDSAQLAGGAIDWSAHLGIGTGYPSGGFYDSLPSEIFTVGAAYPGTQVVQVNHFNSGTLGHFNALGIDTAQNPPISSNDVYRCVGGPDAPTSGFGKPCQIRICLGGVNDGNTCTGAGDCTGGTCGAGSACQAPGVCTAAGNLSSYLRLPPSSTNLYGDNFTALEVWIEASRGQTALLRGDNMADWFNLLSQGRFRAGTADSDTHSSISVQAGGPRTFVASSTDAPGSISAEELAQNVNGMRAIGSNGPFMRVSLNGTASQALGSPRTTTYLPGVDANTISVHVEAPTWAEYDTIDVYINSPTSCQSEWTFFGSVNPSKCSTVVPQKTLTKALVADATHFTVGTSTGVSGFGTRLVSDVSIPVTVAADSWVVVVVRGTDGVSHPLFPIEPQDISETGNDTLSQLTDGGAALPWNLNESGQLALAYSNPLFFDDGDNTCTFSNGSAACPL
ncbi:MAG TPA: carboxypeptidase regulatory-like domain-containing protein [Candidatus Limnocylindrales bacterium]|nr:carboxypeptidase regulatory-like domain-containing protein [Candidatus Limnocylindrales bacterium]